MGALGLKTYIWNNNLKSLLLLAGFPVLLVLMTYGLTLFLLGWGMLPGGENFAQSMALAGDYMWAGVPLAVIVALVWFCIAYVGYQWIIDVSTGAHKVERKDEPDLYNMLENLAISRGMRTPALRIIDSSQLNAFATGLHEGRYSVTVTRGLMQSLDRDEMEAVLAHELTHVINKDVRTMVIASIFAGIISVIAEMVFRGLFYVRGSGEKNKNAGPLILIGLAIAAIGFALAFLIRMSLSRSREFVADAGSVELTKNPDAMISALRKVSGNSQLRAPDEVQGLFLDNTPDKAGFMDMFATHPPIEKRIAALVKFAGGQDVKPVSTAVPTA
ncbi:MAG: M48 family metallopeptidase, partial [Caulobacteraceae bacterium]